MSMPVASTSTVPAYRAAGSPSSSRKAPKTTAQSSASSSRLSGRSDPYYGHETEAVTAARYITSLFQCPNIPPASQPGSPTPTLAHFIAYALHRTRLDAFVTKAALHLLYRLKERFPAARGSSGHRLFISAFMIASKVHCDDTYSNQSWCIVAQKMFALKEINQMEREMCGYLEWYLNGGQDEVLALWARVDAEHGMAAAARSSGSGSSAGASHSVRASPSLPAAPSAASAYPSPEATPDSSRPIRGVRAASRSSRSAPALPAHCPPAQDVAAAAHAFPSPACSPDFHMAAMNSAASSANSSPLSQDPRTPSPNVAATTVSHVMQNRKGDYYRDRVPEYYPRAYCDIATAC
ncbi:hypothetical protein Q5752_003404 [Cryptotrichosporon argae]